MNRPYVFINVAMTADGKIDTFERKGAAISSQRDKERVDQLRAESDAVMVGGKTLLDEDPKLTVKSEELRAGRLTNSYWSVILPLIAINSSFGTFWMRAYFRGVPRQLLDAAAMDGAGSLRILWKVLLPGARPALLTLVVLVFMWSWNEFLLPLVMLSREDLRTAPLGLAFFTSRYTADRVGMAAAAVMVALPVVALFIATHRRFVQGMWAGALKQ